MTQDSTMERLIVTPDIASLALARRYFDALAAKDFPTVAGLFADDIVWHQPGAHRFSGTHRGSGAVAEMIGGMMALSQGRSSSH